MFTLNWSSSPYGATSYGIAPGSVVSGTGNTVEAAKLSLVTSIERQLEALDNSFEKVTSNMAALREVRDELTRK